jgi:hypothetical protein
MESTTLLPPWVSRPELTEDERENLTTTVMNALTPLAVKHDASKATLFEMAWEGFRGIDSASTATRQAFSELTGLTVDQMVNAALSDYIECTVGAYEETLLKKAAQS